MISVKIIFLTFSSHGFVNNSATDYTISSIFSDDGLNVPGQFLKKNKDKIFTTSIGMVILAKQLFVRKSQVIKYFTEIIITPAGVEKNRKFFYVLNC